MAYATTAELEARFEDAAEVTHLTDSETGSPDTTVLDEVLDDASGEIDSAFGMKYEVPVVTSDTQLTARLKSITLDLAVYNLSARRRTVPEIFQIKRDNAVEWLRQVAEGERVPPGATTLASTSSRDPALAFGTSGTVGGTANQRVFSRASQGGL